ncbi:MAG: DEAD/DEAH box helicase, partial [Candidatus Cloacimonadota bacterium]|nr:DEAD/DEAH box helicase [Candidatus Cloacimonadota bacterium]
MIKFEKLGVKKEILRGIQDIGFTEPMPIQEKVIPALLNESQDLIGLAQTGTGKTAAFGIPILQLVDPTLKKTQALVLSPTRELCLQITKDLRSYSKYLPDINIVPIYGGADINRQIRALNRGAHIIVATPGRMNDLLNRRKKIDLNYLNRLVLDEADEMLNMGFKEELDAIIEQTSEKKKTLLFSATMPRDVLKISKNYMHKPLEITVGNKNEGTDKVTHICYRIKERDRYAAIKRLVDYHPEIYGIVFCRTRIETKKIAEYLIKDGYNAEALHGDLSQSQRDFVMNKFRIKNLQLLVATDVAARGLDIDDLTHVLNYNLPDEPIIYTHRSGRTGRAGKKGFSVVLINMRERKKLNLIEKKINKTFEIRTIPSGKDICRNQLLDLVDRMQKIEIDHKEIDEFLPEIYEKLEWLDRKELIKRFVSLEFNRFLDYYKDASDLKKPTEKDTHAKKRDKRSRRNRDPRKAEPGFTRY